MYAPFFLWQSHMVLYNDQPQWQSGTIGTCFFLSVVPDSNGTVARTWAMANGFGAAG